MPDDDAPEPTFHLELDITEPTLVEWLEELPDDQVQPRVEDTLRAGHFVLNLVQAAAGEEQMSRYFRPVTDRMETLKQTLDDFIFRAQKSQRLGEMGEEIVVQRLGESFPGDSFEVVSHRANAADIEAWFEVGADDPVQARIEVKNYTNVVPTPEIEKFRRDLVSTRVQYGLMISLASRLTGVKGSLKLEETERYTAILVSGAGAEGVNMIAATAMLKAIMLYHARAAAARRIPASAIEQAWSRMSAEIDELRRVADEVASIRQSVKDIKSSLVTQLEGLDDKAHVSSILLEQAVGRLTGRIYDELQALPNVARPPALPQPTPPDSVLAELERLETSKDKRAAAFRKVRDLAGKNGVDIHIDEDGTWRFVKGAREIAHTAGTKTRLDVAFPVDPEKEVRIVGTAEKLNGDLLIVECRDDRTFATRVGKRFREATT
jgi:hypothetical protein